MSMKQKYLHDELQIVIDGIEKGWNSKKHIAACCLQRDEICKQKSKQKLGQLKGWLRLCFIEIYRSELNRL